MEFPLFSFGTLMDTDLLELVCEQALSELQLEPATLNDFKPCWVENDHFPVLVSERGAVTNGVIIRGLSELAQQRIIFFEGGEFAVNTLMVVNSAGLAETVNYFADTQRLLISERVWLLNDWQQLTKADTLPRVQRYMQCFGKMSIDEADAYW